MSATAQKTDHSNSSGEETLNFGAEIGSVLNLVINSLYTNKDIFLRELISNASDACDKLRYQALTDASILGEDAELKITIKSDKTTNTLEIRDNGVGMNREDLIENLGTIARSGTAEFISNLTGESKKDSALIGQFGVGFYSAYMVAEKVVVQSCKAGENTCWRWESEGKGSFTISEIPASEANVSRGTSILLYLKDDAADYADSFRLKHIIESYSDHINFPVYQEIVPDESGLDTDLGPTLVNKASALWTKPKSEISDEQYNEFYHHVSHSPDEPFLTLHNKAEGMVEYTSLLFVPSMKPFDLFHPDRRRRVKLYVKRVFISEENVDIVPAYLRFLRGVIDSADLPLNISRETLQDNPILKRIRENITSKVLTELKKRAEKAPEEYAKFWENFGAVLKEGLCEAIADKEREKLLAVCRFHNSEQEGITSLDDYVSRMKDGQDAIYYLAGDNIESLRRTPQLEGFAARGVEVLLLADHVDDFWLNVVRDHQGKSFKSITRSDINLDDFSSAKEAEKSEDGENPTAKVEDSKIEALITLLKESYGETIKDVRTTSKLASAPVCLSVDAGDMDFRMERFLVEHKQLPQRAAKILEVNPDHPLIALLAEKLSANADAPSSDVQDAAQLLLDQAKIMEGEPIDDVAAFSERLGRFMTQALKG